MAEEKETKETTNTTTEKKVKAQKPKFEKNTFEIKLTNSVGQTIIGIGPVTDKEIKQICRMLHGTEDPKINKTNDKTK